MAGAGTTAPPWVSWVWSGTGAAAGTGEPGLASLSSSLSSSSAPVAYLTGAGVDSTATSRPASATAAATAATTATAAYIHEITAAAGTDLAGTTQTARQESTAAVTLAGTTIAGSGSSEFLTDSSALSTAYLTSDDVLLTDVASLVTTSAGSAASATVTTTVAATTAQGIYDLNATVLDRLSFAATTMMDTGPASLAAGTTTWLNGTPSAVMDVVTDRPAAPDTVARDVVLGVLLSGLGLLTVFGNTLVILAIYRERCLRTVTNLFIASLALADFIIGTTVIPFAIYNELRFGQWVFGKPWCDVWHAVDILACTASITNLCVIAVDRYWAITRPMSYPSRMTKKLGTLLIASVWVCSALISFPCIAWWQAVEPPGRPDTDCVFPEDPAYLVFSSCISFYIPSTLMVFMYAQVYRTAVEQVRVIKSGQRKVTSAGPQQGAMSMRVHRGGGGTAVNNNHPTTAYTNGYHARSQGATGGAHGAAKSAVHSAKKSLLAGMNREHKAARTLGIVMGVFIICWLPFFIINVLAPVCPECVVNPHVTFPVLTWLGYANSALNPAIYAFTSRKFKRAFVKILCDCLPQRYRPHKWDKRRRPRRTMSTSNVDPDSSYTMVEYGDMVCRSPDRKVDSTTAILSGGKPHLYSLRQTYF